MQGSQSALSAGKFAAEGDTGSEIEHSKGSDWLPVGVPGENEEYARDSCACAASRFTTATRSDTATRSSKGGEDC